MSGKQGIPSDLRRTYSRTSRARPESRALRGEPSGDEIFVSLNGPDHTGLAPEGFHVRWYLLDGCEPDARVECFDDAIGTLLSCQDLLAAIKDMPGGAGPDEVELALKELGFEDEDTPC